MLGRWPASHDTPVLQSPPATSIPLRTLFWPQQNAWAGTILDTVWVGAGAQWDSFSLRPLPCPGGCERNAPEFPARNSELNTHRKVVIGLFRFSNPNHPACGRLPRVLVKNLDASLVGQTLMEANQGSVRIHYLGHRRFLHAGRACREWPTDADRDAH